MTKCLPLVADHLDQGAENKLEGVELMVRFRDVRTVDALGSCYKPDKEREGFLVKASHRSAKQVWQTLNR